MNSTNKENFINKIKEKYENIKLMILYVKIKLHTKLNSRKLKKTRKMKKPMSYENLS
jgi:hypothetical protein